MQLRRVRDGGLVHPAGRQTRATTADLFLQDSNLAGTTEEGVFAFEDLFRSLKSLAGSKGEGKIAIDEFALLASVSEFLLELTLFSFQDFLGFSLNPPLFAGRAAISVQEAHGCDWFFE